MKRFELDLTGGAEHAIKLEGEPLDGVAAVDISCQAGKWPRVRLAIDLVSLKAALDGKVEFVPMLRHLPQEFFEELREAIDRYLTEAEEE